MRIQRFPKQEESVNQKIEEFDIDPLLSLINKYRDKKGNLIPLLQGAQDIYGYLPPYILQIMSLETDISLSDIYGVATFYSQFRLNPVGKHIIKVCHGTACHVQNAGSISEALEEALGIKDGETTPDSLFTLESVACLGCCSLAPVMMIGDETFGKLTGKSAVKVIKEIKIRESQN